MSTFWVIGLKTRAEASGKFDSYTQDYSPLSPYVLKAIKSIYDDLSDDNLLLKCVVQDWIHRQKKIESFNQLVRKICLKIVNTSSTTIQIAA